MAHLIRKRNHPVYHHVQQDDELTPAQLCEELQRQDSEIESLKMDIERLDNLVNALCRELEEIDERSRYTCDHSL